MVLKNGDLGTDGIEKSSIKEVQGTTRTHRQLDQIEKTMYYLESPLRVYKIHTMGYYSPTKKRNPSVYNNVSEPQGYYAK